jgi:hypothetical protein
MLHSIRSKGTWLGLAAAGSAMLAVSVGAQETMPVRDVVGGNERVFEMEIPPFGEPVPLPNPDVHQSEEQPPRMEVLEIPLGIDEQTEVKVVLPTGKMVLYSWEVDQGEVYSDFHAHEPGAPQEHWVRYVEHQEASSAHGSLVAPISGEHGWYWMNINDHPIVITLTVYGFFDDVVDYGIF